MLKEQILNFTTILGCTLALGVFFDTILISKEQRLQISKVLQARKSRTPFDAAFYRYINLINDSVFNRYFNNSFFTVRYFISTAVLSTVFLITILTVQFAFEPGAFASFPKSAAQAWVFVICFASNLLIDWVSVGQTQAFFRISAQLKSVRDSSLLIVSDFILTINFFVLIFALTLGYLIYLSDLPKTEGQFRATISSSQVRPSSINHSIYTPQHFSNPIQTEHTLTGRLNSGEELAANLTVFSDTNRITLQEVIQATTHYTGLQSSSFKIHLIEGDYKVGDVPEDIRSRAKAGHILRGSPEWQILTDKYWSEEQDIVINASRHPQGLDGQFAYSVGYNEAEAMERDFPGTISFSPKIIDVSQLLDSYSYARSTTLSVIYGCDLGAFNKPRWLVGDRLVLVGKCTRRFSISNAEFARLTTAMRKQGTSFGVTKVPVNALFMTSLVMTFLIYSFTLFLIVAKFISSTFLAEIAVLAPVFSKAPLGVAGVAIGLVLYLTTLF